MAFTTEFVPVPLYSMTSPAEINLAKTNNVVDRSFSLWASKEHWIGVMGYTAPDPESDLPGKFWSDPYVSPEADEKELLPYVVLDFANPIDLSKPNWNGHASWSIYSPGFYNFVQWNVNFFEDKKIPGLKVQWLAPSNARRLNLHKANIYQVPFTRGERLRDDMGLRFHNGKIEAFLWQQQVGRR